VLNAPSSAKPGEGEQRGVPVPLCSGGSGELPAPAPLSVGEGRAGGGLCPERMMVPGPPGRAGGRRAGAPSRTEPGPGGAEQGGTVKIQRRFEVRPYCFRGSVGF